jgi:hypothetical protein
MSKSIVLDTNSLILLSGIEETDGKRLLEKMEKNNIKIFVTHVQIDEKITKEYSEYEQKIKKALARLANMGIGVVVEPTKEAISDVSRWGMARFGSEMLSKIDSALRTAIKACMDKKGKKPLHNAKDALIAISLFNHDYFFTNDECLYKAWVTIVETNYDNKKALRKEGYIIPQIFRRKKPETILEKIIEL